MCEEYQLDPRKEKETRQPRLTAKFKMIRQRGLNGHSATDAGFLLTKIIAENKINIIVTQILWGGDPRNNHSITLYFTI